MIEHTLFDDGYGRLTEEAVVRGYPWPAGRYYVLRLVYRPGWTPGVHNTWAWALRLDDRVAGGAADVTITAASAVISGPSNEFLDLSFQASAADSAALAGTGRLSVFVDLLSEHGAPTVSEIWPAAHGRAAVRDAVGS